MSKIQSLKIIAIFLITVLPKTFFGQNVSEIFQFADSQYEIGNYSSATYYFERTALFGNPNERFESYLRLADCAAATGNFARAGEYCQLCISLVSSDSLKSEIFFRRISYLILENKPKLALAELLAFNNSSEIFTKRKLFYRGISQYIAADYQFAYNSFRDYALKYKPEIKDSIEIIFNELAKVNKKSVHKIKIMSMIIPGLGQLAVGDKRNAANSFLLNGTLTSLCIIIGLKIGWVNSILSFAPWLMRYYQGGARKAALLAQERLNFYQQKYYFEILKLVN